MGGIGASLEVETRGDPAALHEALWALTERLVHDRVPRALWDEELLAMASCPTDFAREHPRDSIRSLGGDRVELVYWFHDFSGLCTRSMTAWEHWTRLVWAAHGGELHRLFETRGARVVSGREELAALVDPARTPRFVEVDSRLLLVQQIDDETILIGADERVAPAAVPDRCLCPLCRQMRPEPAFYADWLARVAEGEDDDDELESIGLWMLSACARSSEPAFLATLLMDLVRNGREGSFAEDLLRRIGRATPAWSVVAAHAETLDAGQACLVRNALDPRPADEALPEVELALLAAQLTPADPIGTVDAAEVLAERFPDRDRAAAAIAKLLDRPLPFGAHDGRLDLIEMLGEMPAARLSPSVRVQLTRAAAEAGDVGRAAAELLARWS
jgi:hypothetical protein